MKIVLASKSPRRQELLRVIGINDFEIMPAVGEENDGGAKTPQEAVCAISKHKALEIAEKCSEDTLIIAADTLVYLDGEPIGKPKDEEDAKMMLRALSGRDHKVLTGVALVLGGKVLTQCEETAVFFRNMTDDEIDGYIKTKEPMDKAGAYGAQGIGSIFVEKIEGDFFNVMGLPLCRLCAMLKEFGIKLV